MNGTPTGSIDARVDAGHRRRLESHRAFLLLALFSLVVVAFGLFLNQRLLDGYRPSARGGHTSASDLRLAHDVLAGLVAVMIGGALLYAHRLRRETERAAQETEQYIARLENESVLVQHRTTAIERLEELRRAGVRIGIDDFGVGHSSISHLHELPVQIMKIHGSFVARMMDGGLSPVPAMIAMGHDLGFVTIAEGVEDEAAYRRLGELGCDDGQGYWMARPADAATTSAFLAGPGIVLPAAAGEPRV